MTQHAKGTFDVKVVPIGTEDKERDPGIGRMSLNKDFQGDFVGSGKGEMLTGGTDVKESGAYVAIERVTGTLQGRTGSFMLAHRGTMARGKYNLEIDIVPDSGTGELAGIAGSLTITIVEKKHFYELSYTLE
ncbi:MAG: DUF3224 domain-containing protein [Gemmatimonadaceae bacterium]